MLDISRTVPGLGEVKASEAAAAVVKMRQWTQPVTEGAAGQVDETATPTSRELAIFWDTYDLMERTAARHAVEGLARKLPALEQLEALLRG
jgi:hypothetical protein